MKNKIFIFITILTVLLSVLVIPSFAYDFNGVIVNGDDITFTETLRFQFYPNTTSTAFRFYIADDPNGTEYNSIAYQYPGRTVLVYYTAANTYLTVYDEYEGGWIKDYYRHIIAKESVVLEGTGLGFMSMNIEEPETPSVGIYDDLHGLIKSGIFGERELDGYEILCLDFIVSVLSFLIVALPFITLWLIIKGILSAFRGIWD